MWILLFVYFLEDWMCFSTGAVQGSLRWALYLIRFSFACYMTKNEYVLDIVLLPAKFKTTHIS